MLTVKVVGRKYWRPDWTNKAIARILLILLMLLQSGCVLYIRVGPQEIDIKALTQRSKPVAEVEAVEPNTGINLKAKIDSK